MLEPRKNWIVFKFFSWYINRIIKTDFHDLLFNEINLDRNRAVLLLANHFSWWDGFVLFQINRIYFKKNFHVMISHENYRTVWFLKYLGSFSVKKKSRSIIETLEYAGKLLNDPNNLVLIFPQGKLHSGHVEDVIFEKGLMNLISSSSKSFQYVFAASFSDYFQNRKPTINCYLQEWEGAEFTSLQLIKSAFNKHYEYARQKQTAIAV
jgi:1-acyl-sn-glycerol-3-phosphate acyltransferase